MERIRSAAMLLVLGGSLPWPAACGSASTALTGDAIDGSAEDSPGDAPVGEDSTGGDAEAEVAADVEVDFDAGTGADADAEAEAETAADADAGGCGSEPECMTGLLCCGGRCVNPLHDPGHCGGCDSPCGPSSPFCDGGACAPRPCDTGIACVGTTYCCGLFCCGLDQVCCVVEGPGPIGGPRCYDGVCPGGCPLCD